jgi:hypothetical protein
MPPAKARGAVPVGLPVHRVLNHGALLCTIVRCGHKHGVPKYAICCVQKCNQITLHQRDKRQQYYATGVALRSTAIVIYAMLTGALARCE